MACLIGSNAGPVAVVGFRHAGKAVDRIPCQIDGVELDMRYGVDQGSAPFDRIEFALREFVWGYQTRQYRSTGNRD